MAAWWNPFSWNWNNIFNAILEKEITVNNESLFLEEDVLLFEEQKNIKFSEPVSEKEDLRIIEKPEIEFKPLEDSKQLEENGFTLEELISMGTQPVPLSQPLIIEQSFYNQLVFSYEDKINFIEKKIKEWELIIFAIGLNIEDIEEGISCIEEDATSDFYDLSYAITMYNLEKNEAFKFLKIWEDRIIQYKEIRNKIKDRLIAFDKVSFMSEAEYLLYQKELNLLVREDLIEEEEVLITSKIYFTYEKKEEIDEKILSGLEIDKKKAKQEIDNLQLEIDELDKQILDNKLKMMDASSKIIESMEQPAQIRCETSNNGYGKMTTTCSENFSGESIRCETSNNGYGKMTTTCSENLLKY
ncbi:MAG: hypothetical protein WCS83_04540 [Endomicrobiia bacterium]